MTQKKNGKKPPTSLVVQQLILRPNPRNVVDVGKWRQAIKTAEMGRREQLYNLYEDILLDNVLSSAIEKRIMSITNSELTFMRDEQPVPEMEDLIDSPAFEDLITEIMNARFWGKSVIELSFQEGGMQIYNIPRKHLRVDKGLIVINPSDEAGIPYRDDDFLMEVGADKDLGLILRAAPYAIYKRGGFGDWSQFAELFGMPFKIGKYSNYDEQSRQVLEQAMDQAGSAPWIVVPKETDIDIKDAKSGGDGSLYDMLRKACNEEILIGILGQTMTTVDGASRAQGEVHKEVEEGANKADRRFVQRILNTRLLPRLEKRGYPVSGGFFWFPDAGENLTVEQQLSIHSRLVNELGLEIDEDFLYETYSVPRAKVTKKSNPDPPVKKENQEQEKLVDDPPTIFDMLKDRALRFFVKAPITGACNCTIEQQDVELALENLPSFDDHGLFKRIAEGQDYFDPELYQYHSSSLIHALNEGFRKQNLVGIDYDFEPDALKTAMQINIFHFSAAKTLSQIHQLNQAWRESKNLGEFSDKASLISGKFNKSWLRTEYDTAYLTAESSATYHRLLSQSNIFKHWQYVTVGDNKVREEHRELDGIILPYDDPLWNKIYPPNGWSCRCRVSPKLPHEVNKTNFSSDRERVSRHFQTNEWKKVSAQGFGVNRAKEAIVFHENQMYIRKFPNNAATYLKDLYYNKWGLKETGSMMKQVKEKTPVYKETAEKWWAANKMGDKAVVKDYVGRSVHIAKDTFEHHTTGKKEPRTQLLEAAKATMLEPDEVWLNDYKDRFDNYVYVKFYNDNMMVAVCGIEKGELVVKTWFDAAVQSNKKRSMNPRWNIRRGLLVFNKNSAR